MFIRISKWIAALAVITLLACETPFHAQDYFPLEESNRWVFSGPFGTLQAKAIGPKGHYRIAFLDSLNNEVSELSCRIGKEAVEWTAFQPLLGDLPSFEFAPPLLLTPFSEKMGEKRVVEGVEMRQDSLISEWPVRVIYQIESVEPVHTAAGDFEHCIKMRMSTLYLKQPEHAYLAGEVIWWFARNVGPVKYSFASGQGELLSARIGDKIWPQTTAP